MIFLWIYLFGIPISYVLLILVKRMVWKSDGGYDKTNKDDFTWNIQMNLLAIPAAIFWPIALPGFSIAAFIEFGPDALYEWRNKKVGEEV